MREDLEVSSIPLDEADAKEIAAIIFTNNL